MSSQVIYNGIQLDLLTILQWDRKAVLDGPTYLWTEHTIHVRTIYEPFATSYLGTATGATQQDGILAPLTDVALRHMLTQPRKQLLISVGGALMFAAPNRPGAATDAANGPFVEIHSISEFMGTQSMVVDVTFRASIIECAANSPPVVLSHRFSIDVDIDQDWFQTRTVTGHATLRSDRRLELGFVPDDFRSALFLPVPTGHKREDIKVKIDEDGNTLSYQYVDREKYASIVTGRHITRIEASHSISLARAPVSDAGYAAVARTGAAIRDFRDARRVRLESRAQGWISPRESLIPIIGPAITAFLSLVPQVVHVVDVVVHGDRFSNREEMTNVAQRIIAVRLAEVSNSGEGQHFDLVWDLMEGSVHATFTHTHSVATSVAQFAGTGGVPIFSPASNPVQALFNTFTGSFTAVTNFGGRVIGFLALTSAAMPPDHSIPGIISKPPATQPAPPNSNASRGTSVGRLVVQVLSDACNVQPGTATTQPETYRDSILR